jgi:hypothetical protein
VRKAGQVYRGGEGGTRQLEKGRAKSHGRVRQLSYRNKYGHMRRCIHNSLETSTLDLPYNHNLVSLPNTTTQHLPDSQTTPTHNTTTLHYPNPNHTPITAPP